jgi:hypothetical protein
MRKLTDPLAWYPRSANARYRGGNVEDRGEVCLAEEVERLRRLGLSDGEIASRIGVDASWVETLVSPGEDEPESEV